MSEIAVSMIHRSLEAFVRRDMDLARAVIADDDQVDDLYDQVYRELFVLLMEDPSGIRQANLLLFASHDFERAADRATNICERVMYCVTGNLVDTGWEEDVP